MDFPLLKNLTEKDLKGKNVLLRTGFNLPIKDGRVIDNFRLKKSLPTLSFLKESGAKIFCISHHSDEKQSLEVVSKELNSLISTRFGGDVLKFDFNNENVNEGEVILFENLRFHPEEENNSKDFAKALANHADIYVNDAFSVSHRDHASITTVAEMLPTYAGLLFEEEVAKLSAVFAPKRPFLFVLGGGKPKSKFHLIKKFLNRTDVIFAGGALAHIFLKHKGYEIGNSIYEEVADKEMLDELIHSGKVMIPSDVAVETPTGPLYKSPNEVKKDEKILDIGPKTIEKLKAIVPEMEFIVWNGPLGDYLIEGFDEGTKSFAHILADYKLETIVGGGDTIAVINKEEIRDRFSFVSTGGGAMLEFFSEGTLPGIKALQQARRGV
jgi:phosphoglycerate kinase